MDSKLTTAKFLKIVLGIALVVISLWLTFQLKSGLISLAGSGETAVVFGYIISLLLPVAALLLGVVLIVNTIRTIK